MLEFLRFYAIGRLEVSRLFLLNSEISHSSVEVAAVDAHIVGGLADVGKPRVNPANLQYSARILEDWKFELMEFEYWADATQPSPQDETNGWGEIKSVKLPTGAETEYEYFQDNTVGGENAENVLARYVEEKDLQYDDQDDGSSALVSNKWHYLIYPWESSADAPDGNGSSESFIYNQSFPNLWGTVSGLQFAVLRNRQTHSYCSWMVVSRLISKLRQPVGVFTLISSPSSLPISAWPMGERVERKPFSGSPSSGVTSL